VKYSKTTSLKESNIDTNMTSLVDTIEKELKKWFGARQKKSSYNSYTHTMFKIIITHLHFWRRTFII